MLGVANRTSAHEPDQTSTASCNILKCCIENFTNNNTQHVATGWPNACTMLCPTMLRYVELKRLAGALGEIFPVSKDDISRFIEETKHKNTERKTNQELDACLQKFILSGRN